MSIILIGSQALYNKFPEYRKPKLDYDIMATVEDFTRVARAFTEKHGQILKVEYTTDGNKVFAFFEDKFVLECEIIWPGSLTEELAKWVDQCEDWSDSYITMCNCEDGSCEGKEYIWIRTPPLEFLYMLKMSHRYKKNSPHFLKTMRDIQFMRQQGAELVDRQLEKLYKKRMKETYNYKHPNLKQTKKDFFTDDVPYKYDHDSIHRAISYLDAPAYTKVKDCQDEVYMKKANFFDSPEMIRILCVVEESMVLSLERAIIPFDLFNDPEKINQAFKMALFKVCTSITSGWFREYAWENYDRITYLFERDQHTYVKKFLKGLDSGIVLLYTKPAY